MDLILGLVGVLGLLIMLVMLLNVVVATHKTIDLVVHTRVKKLQRTMQK